MSRQMEGCSYMCGECFQVYDSIVAFNKHVCHSDTESVCRQKGKPPFSSQREQSSVINVSPEPHSSGAPYSPCGKPVYTKEKEGMHGSVDFKAKKSSDIKTETITTTVVSDQGDLSDHEDTQEEEEDGNEETVKKRKKYQAMDDTYRLNRTMRDKDFKLARSHFYCFKDTLGDWDERSTQFLIKLIHKYPKTHFLLSMKTEKRMGHWESLHKEMETAGHTFTILQLRMRWREVLQKYRWTVDYNDQHEIKKRCEYFDEMNELFGDWDKEATHSLLRQMHRVKLENQNKKIVRIGYSGWEKITENLNNEGHRFTMNMVEGRWRNMVTLYKTMVDHNVLPNVEPRSVAYKKDLEELVKYVPQRRHNYEKKKGRSVIMERFPTSGSRTLLQAYKDCIGRFMDPAVDNSVLWDEITQKLEDVGFSFTTFKLKEILNGMIKGFEKCQYHNSLPGAIRRDVPYYRELAEIYGVYGRWPHIQTSRTVEMRIRRKFRLRLQVSQQLWSSEESRALLHVYPDVLESHVNQNLSHQVSDLWLQVAKAYAATGYPKRDVPEIAIHMGLLRQGYVQGNVFPFMEEMRRVKETEEAVCYSPDVSKFTGDVEIIYWSHEAVNHLLDLYIKYQASASSSHACKDEVFTKITEKMQEFGYGYTKNQVFEQFKTLLTQYNTRKSKTWIASSSGRHSQNPLGAPYWEKLHKVLELRKMMSLSWTTGVKPLTIEAQKIVYNVAYQKAEELLVKKMTDKEQVRLLAEIIEGVRVHIRTNKLLDPVPRTRQVRLHLTNSLKNFDENSEDNQDIKQLHSLLADSDMLKLLSDVTLEPTNYDSKVRNPKTRKRHLYTTKKGLGIHGKQEGNARNSEAEFASNTYLSWISEEEPSDFLKCQGKESRDVAAEYLTFALCCLKSDLDKETVGNTNYIKENNENHEPHKKDAVSCCVKDYGFPQGVDVVEQRTSEDRFGNVNAVTSQLCDIHSTPLLPKQRKIINKKMLQSTEDLPQESINSNSDSTQDVPSSSCKQNLSGFSLNESTDDIYEKLFGEVHNLVPKSYSLQGKGAFYTFSGISDSDLILHLPKELTLYDHGNIFNKKLSEKNQFDVQRKKDANYMKDSFSDFSESDTGNASECEFGNSEEDSQFHDSGIQNRSDPETKIIQTRSGRKTRFTFFSKTLNNDSDDDITEEEKCSSNSQKLSPTQKRLKLESEPVMQITAPKRKRGRPRKNREPETVLNYKVLRDGSAVIQRDSPENMTSSQDELGGKVSKVDKNLECITNPRDCVLSYLEEHQTERVKKEEELINILKAQQAEQANVLTKMLDIFQDLKSKLKVRK
ncbi:uncharacterized protein [Panulirus ornatus]|uniref:uncharacterized protein isoform X2 n=1 Tax=Panulirus ornatus TaxID=150431 RepID=UPI003A8461AD